MEPARKGRFLRALDVVERIGNRLPDPLTLFAIFSVLVVVASTVTARAGVSAVHPATGATVAVVDLATRAGVRRMLTEAVANFASFPPLATVLVAMIGVGVAEHSGLIRSGLRALVLSVPKSALTATLIFAGVNAHVAADAGLVILPPLGALLFRSVGRHPLAGLCAAFAAVSGGFSASVLITPLDPLLAGLTESAARLLDPSYRVAPTANYYFMIVSTFMLTIVGTWVTHRFVEPRFGRYEGEGDAGDPRDPGGGVSPREELLAPLSATEKRGLWAAVVATVALAIAVALLVLPQDGILRDDQGGLGPFFSSLMVLIMLAFLAAGLAYGVRTGSIRNDKDVARMMAEALAIMGHYIVLAFVAAQFVAYFGWSNLGLIIAVKGAASLKALGLTGPGLLVAIVAGCVLINLLVASASAKWAVMGPVLVPMLMLLGYSPELVQATYRVGDSVANIITPLMPYFPLLIAFAHKWDKRAGVGTIISATLPYTIAFGITWTILLVIWTVLDLPLGPGAPVHYLSGPL